MVSPSESSRFSVYFLIFFINNEFLSNRCGVSSKQSDMDTDIWGRENSGIFLPKTMYRIDMGGFLDNFNILN